MDGRSITPDFLLETGEVSEHEMFDFFRLLPSDSLLQGKNSFPQTSYFSGFSPSALLYNGNSIFFTIEASLKFFSGKSRFSLHSKYKKVLTLADCLPASLEFRARGEQASDLIALTAVWAFVLVRATRLRLVNCTSSHPSSEITAA